MTERSETYDPAIGYFIEEVRRRLIERYGETAKDGPDKRLFRRPSGAHVA